MQHRKTLSSVVAPLVVAAIAAPAAVAMPIDNARQADMHASTVQKPAAAELDLRSEAAQEASKTPVRPQTGGPIAKGDLRTEAAADTTRAPEAPVGLPTWPVNPKPLTPVTPEPVATGGGDGDGIEWPLSGILVAGALLLGGTLGVAGTRYRVSHTHVA
jgi:hypothetical protein